MELTIFQKIKQEASGYPEGCVSEKDKQDFVQKYFDEEGLKLEPDNIKKNKGKGYPIYFMGAIHRQHNPVIACGWTKRGEDSEVRSYAGRRRVNIIVTIDLERLELVVRFDDTIYTDSSIPLFEQLEELNLAATLFADVKLRNCQLMRNR